MRFVLGALALAGMTAGVSAQTPKPVEAPRPDAGERRAAPGDLGMAIMSARVSAGGVLWDGAGAVSAVRLGLGTYRVTFGRNVANCTTAATSNSSAAAVARTTNENDYITAFWYRDKMDAPIDTSFSLIVYCHR